MADDPTVQLFLRLTRECPTCGHNVQPDESECSLCGTTLPRDVPPRTPPQNPLAPTVVASPSAGAADPIVIAPLPPRPSRIEEEPVKVAPPPRRSASVKEAAGTAPRRVTPPTPPRPISPVSSLPEPPLESRTAQPSVSLPPLWLQSNALKKWGGLAVGVLALLLVGFFAIKMFSPSQKGLVIQPPAEGTTASVGREKDPANEDTKKKDSSDVLSPPLPPQLVGQVITAGQLPLLRVFGADENDEVRGTGAFRSQVEERLQGIREAYSAHIGQNSQALGVVVLEMNIAPEGQVKKAIAHVTGSVSLDLQQAIETAVKDWRFTSAQGGEVKVFYPLLLVPEKIDPGTFVSQVKNAWPGRYRMFAETPVPIRAEANDNAEEVGAIRSGLFLVVSSQNGWLGTLSPKGKVGYVRQDSIFLRVENATPADAKG